MTIRKAKTSPKIFESDSNKLKKIALRTMDRISDIVGSTFGPGGKNTLIESDYPGLPNKNTKDGVTVFRSLGSYDPYEHLVIEQARDAAQRTATEAGDGTTSSTIISAALIRRLFEFCESNRKYSPQKAARLVNKTVRDTIAPAIRKRSIAVTEDNKGVLEKVAKVSANGDEDMAKAVIEAFDAVGYGENSHVTIKELSGPGGYSVELIDGFPIPIGYEESIGKFHPAFINDQANQRCLLEKPLFLLFDGKITNIMTLAPVLERVGQKFMDSNQDTSFMNVVIFAHGFSEDVLNHAAFNFNSPHTINFVPVVTPMNLLINSQTHFLHDLAAFTGAKVFGMDDHLGNADIEHMGRGMEVFECYRFRSTVVGDSDSVNIEVRADEIRKQMENAESVADKRILEERLGKLTNGIAKLTIRAGSSGELKEAHDRCEDAVCSVRCAISDGVLPGGCRVLLDMSINLMSSEDPVLKEVIAPALMEPIIRLLENAGYQGDEIGEIISKLQQNPDLVYDVENQVFGTADETGVFDATKAVTESVLNAASIASVMGSLGGIVAYPRDNAFELSEAKADSEFERSVTRADEYVNEANLRP